MDTATETKQTKIEPAEVMGKLNDSISKAIDEKFATEKAKLEESIKQAVTGFPWVPILLGGGTSVLVTELVDGFLAPKAGATAQQIQMNAYLRGGAKIGGAIAALLWLKKVKVYGKDGAMATAVLTGFDGIRDIIPFDVWIKENIVAKITALGTGGLGRNVVTPNPRQTGSVVEF